MGSMMTVGNAILNEVEANRALNFMTVCSANGLYTLRQMAHGGEIVSDLGPWRWSDSRSGKPSGYSLAGMITRGWVSAEPVTPGANDAGEIWSINQQGLKAYEYLVDRLGDMVFDRAEDCALEDQLKASQLVNA